MPARPLHHLRTAPVAVIAIDAAGRLLDLNSSASGLFGVDRSAALGRQITEFLRGLPRPGADPREDVGGAVGAQSCPTAAAPLALTGCRAEGSEFPAEVILAPAADDPSVELAWIRERTACAVLRAESFRRAAVLNYSERLSCAGSWEWEPASRRLVCSKNLRRLLGLDADSHVDPRNLLHEHSHPDDRTRLDQAYERMIDEGEVSPIDVRLTGADGELRYMRFAARLLPDEEHQINRVIGIMRDVTAERLAARRTDMRLAVSRALAEWRTAEQSAPELLEALATTLGCEVATLWVPDRDVLIPRFTWTTARLAGSGFERATRRLRLPKAIELAGWAWELRRPVDLATLTAARSYIRREEAQRAGLKTAVALPAMCGEEVVAVIDLHAPEKVRITVQSLETLAGVGHEIGQVLASRRAQLVTNPLTPRELEVLTLAAGGFATTEIAKRLVVQPSTVKTHLDHIYSKLAVSDRAAAVAQALRRGLID